MTKAKIEAHAAKFIADAGIKEWNQESHNAFVAYALKREIAAENGDNPELADAIATIRACQAAMPSLTANASAFRQWLESKDIALLVKQEAATAIDRYAKLI